MRMTHPNKPRIPNSFAIAAGLVLLLGSVILGGPSGSMEQQASACEQPVCASETPGTTHATEDESRDSNLLQHTAKSASRPLEQVAESGRQAIRTQLLLLIPGR